jgi:hypothetical protein
MIEPPHMVWSILASEILYPISFGSSESQMVPSSLLELGQKSVFGKLKQMSVNSANLLVYLEAFHSNPKLQSFNGSLVPTSLLDKR